MFKDYYAILEVTETATQEEIKVAFKRQALKWHPDRNPSEDTTQRMQEINEAYLILKDTEARERYNREYQLFKQYQSQREQSYQEQQRQSEYQEQAEQKEKENQKTYEYVDYKIDDDILKKWMDNAKRQAVDLAKQTIEDLKGMVKVGAKAAVKEGGNMLMYQIIFGVIGLIVFGIIKSCNQDTSYNKDNQPANYPSANSVGNKDSTVDISKQLWFVNPEHGLSFETPYKIEEESLQDLPSGTSNYFTNRYGFTYNDSDYGINYQVMELNPIIKTFDTRAGLNGAVGNFINGLRNGGGTQLNLQFYAVKNNYNNTFCEGTFNYLNEQMKVNGYCLFKNGVAYVLIGIGGDSKVANEKLARTFESIYIIGDKNSAIKNKLRKL